MVRGRHPSEDHAMGEFALFAAIILPSFLLGYGVREVISYNRRLIIRQQRRS